MDTSSLKANRNDLCPCGSGKKYKKCCLQSATGLPSKDLLSTVRQLQPLIEDFGQQLYGSEAASAAWQSFSRWGIAAIARDEHAYLSAFNAWFLFAWLPDDMDSGVESFKSKPSDQAIAFDYLESHKDSLGLLEQSVIKISSKSPYSFYSIITVVSDSRLQVQEIYTGDTVMVDVLETSSYLQGDVLFTAVLSVNVMSVLLGCMPVPLAASDRAKVEAHREKWRAEEGKAIDRRLLYLHDTELRRFYFMLMSQAQRAQLH
nr:SEC-C domain-containing protein [Granulosicoccus sp.]